LAIAPFLFKRLQAVVYPDGLSQYRAYTHPSPAQIISLPNIATPLVKN